MSPENKASFSTQEIIQSPEELRHECGVVGIWEPGGDVARSVFYSLLRLQHRGQESSGIATLSREGMKFIKRMGLVREGFAEEDIESLTGFAAIGHTRYSNTGGTTIANAQPAVYGQIAIAENGNLLNSEELRAELDSKGIFSSVTPDGIKCSSDGEIIVQTIAVSQGNNALEKIINACCKFQGAYTLTILAENSLFAVRDPKGFWPLCLGRFNGDGYIVASESVAFRLIGAEYIREVEPGEVLSINSQGLASYKLSSDGQIAECPFDWTYFRRPDSLITPERFAYQFRMELGRQLVRDFPVEADIVIAEKDSGTYGAHGFSRESGILFNEGSIKDPYSRRIFIDPDPRIRDSLVDLKHSFLEPEIRGQRVVVITDSIVRGTNSRGIVGKLKRIGAKEVHYRVTFPRIAHPCFFGIDTASKKELIGAGKTVEEICQVIGANSLAYQTLEGFEKVLGRSLKTFCNGCFTGQYPVSVSEERNKFVLEPLIKSQT